jgi:hypothetical protein
MHRVMFLFFCTFFFITRKVAAQLRLPSNSDSATRFIHIKLLPQNFYKQNLSFFCQQELRLQKLTSLPLYFRVGSKDYVDYLEKKPNAAKPR